jgi:signal transduction histidine kinase/CheY-like chemotaxis protein
MPATSSTPIHALPAPDVGVPALVDRLDWMATPLGPRAEWPQSLETAVRILLTSRFAMWMAWGPELTMLYNDAYARMTLGKKHPWALGRSAREVWAEIWPDIGPRIQQVLETGVATWDEQLLLFLERSGYPEETYHTFSYSPLAADDGRITGMLCVVTEETERVIGERRLSSLRELSSALAATGTEAEVIAAVERTLGANAWDLPFTATYLLDADGTRARRAACTGFDGPHPAAPPTLDVLASDAPWPIVEALDARGPLVLGDLDERFAGLPGGVWERAPHVAVIAPIAQQGHESPAGFLVAGVNPFRPLDASYRGFLELLAGQLAASLANARAYEAEKQRAESLAQLDRAKTAFFSNVSHEFRTPLTLLLGPAEDALADPETRPTNRERMATIHRNALRLLKLVNTLLDFSRIEAGRAQATYERTDLAAYTAELASTFRSAVERAGLRLVVDAPPLGEPAFVDRDMWEKVVLNLLSNAFKHTFEGEIAVRVTRRDGHAAVAVADTGVGIPPEQVPHVFERFHRVPNARSRTHEGTGIGLALVQELVRLHGGTLHVESVVNAGTTFTVELPLGSAHLAAERVASAPTRSARGGAAAFVEEALRWLPGEPGESESETAESRAAEAGAAVGVRRARVLVADDNTDMREYVARLLRGRGWEVDGVANGRQALEHVRARTPDLVVSDVMMPEMDGVELIGALRADEATRAVPVVLLSARAGEEARVEGMRAGADDYLVKPFAARELLARVETQLRRADVLAVVRRERARLHELFAQAPAIIAVLRGPDHVYESANALYLRVAGDRDILGKPIREALPELAGQGIYELLDQVYTTGRPYVGDGLLVRLASGPDGALEDRFFNFVYHPIRDPDGAVSSIFVHGVDVTDTVRARKEAEEANRSKSAFLAAMSHELRTPLNAIAGHAQLMEIGVHGPLTDAQREALTRIQRSEAHLLALINDVLNFAKLEAGRVEYDIEPVPLGEVVADVLAMMEPQLATRRLTASAVVPTAIVAHADREKVRQILLNLLSNAVKFTPPGGRVSVDTPDGVTGVRVSDTGIGIPREKLAMIFDPFVQVHRDLTRSIDGTGLGLAISRDLARGMRGDLTVESTEGVGSSFVLTLPSA